MTEEALVCANHPHRETTLRCNRCEAAFDEERVGLDGRGNDHWRCGDWFAGGSRGGSVNSGVYLGGANGFYGKER